MSSARLVVRSTRTVSHALRTFTTSSARLVEHSERCNDTVDEYRKIMMSKKLTPHMTNTNSTIANEMPAVGKDSAPPEFLSSVDPKFVPKDSVPENTDRMTGGTQPGAPEKGVNSDLAVGEIEGGQFRVEPLRRTGEDIATTRARLTYQSRKRGTLESDLLCSTFADANLGKMTAAQLQQYDLFLDENDWDIYYWVTQEAPQTSMAYAEGAGPGMATPDVQGKAAEGKPERAPDGGPISQTDGWRVGKPRSGEWAQTIGTFKPAYRPVPARWKNSEILFLMRKHVEDRKAGGVHDANEPTPTQGQGLGMMPKLKVFDRA